MISIVLCIQARLIVDSLSRPEFFGSFEVEHKSLEPRSQKV